MGRKHNKYIYLYKWLYSNIEFSTQHGKSLVHFRTWRCTQYGKASLHTEMMSHCLVEQCIIICNALDTSLQCDVQLNPLPRIEQQMSSPEV